MTLEEFDKLKIGDVVIMSDMHNGIKAGYPEWIAHIGEKATITGPYVGGRPGSPGYWPGQTEDGLMWAFIWPDNINFPGKVLVKNSIKCECGAVKIGIKLHQAGHSAWCPGA